MLTILSFIVVIGVIIFVHELGHFLAAKSVGIRDGILHRLGAARRLCEDVRDDR
jgi:hypothetical protein